jgi:hypothetical protein
LLLVFTFVNGALRAAIELAKLSPRLREVLEAFLRDLIDNNQVAV